MTDNIVAIKDLKINFLTYEGVMKVLDGINIKIKKGEVLGLVGETGCGKTMTGRSIMRILPPNTQIISGNIIFLDEMDLLRISNQDMRNIRGNKIAMIFQEPQRSLHPTMKVGNQISEVYWLHMKKEIINATLNRLEEDGRASDLLDGIRRRLYKNDLHEEESLFTKLINTLPFLKDYLYEAINETLWDHSIEMLKRVQIPDPDRVSNQYPHELSGGMMQRVLISIALACSPELLIADEPTTAVDVTTQAKLLDLMMDLKQTYGGSILLITHNLALIAELSDRVCVMYAGTVVETADTMSIFKNPLHPYSKGLLNAIPVIGSDKELESIPGSVPNFLKPPEGCRFHPRCELAIDICIEEKPILREVENEHFVACHNI